MFHKCRCYVEKNFYIPALRKHVNYNDIKYLRTNAAEVGNWTEEEVCAGLEQLETERHRRLNQDKESEARKEEIRNTYTRLHTCVYTLKTEFLSPDFLELVSYCKQPDADVGVLLQMVQSEQAERTYSFPVFTQRFCDLLIEELEHFEESSAPKGRPNTMNNYGVLLDELGFYETFISPLRDDYLNPLCRLLYPDWCGPLLDSHKAFVVTYKVGQDLDLALHYDNAEVTLNVSLGKEFEEGSLYFGAMRSDRTVSDKVYTQCVHRPTVGILHRGQHMHGAMAIERGERYNLIIWMRSSTVRNKRCPMCDEKPVLVRGEGFADGFTGQEVDVCHVI